MTERLDPALYQALRISRTFQRVMVFVWPVLFLLVVFGLVAGRFEDSPVTGVVMCAALLLLAVFSVYRLRNLDRRLAESEPATPEQ